MLVLSRKHTEAIVIGGTGGFSQTVKVTVISIQGGTVKLGFEADAEVPVNRFEVWERIRRETASVDSGS
jgi:carbon storage regulator CsrA